MRNTAIFTSVATTLLLLASPALADEHIPGPDDSSSPSQMLAVSSSASGARAIKQRQARTTYKAVRGGSVEDARYLGRSIPLDIASVTRVDEAPLALDITLWDAPAELAPEAMVVFFATPGAMAPQWAAYQPAPTDDDVSPAWALFRYDPATGLFDERVADAQLDQSGESFRFRAERDADMPRTLVSFVQTSSGDDEDWAWKDQAPTRRTGLKIR